MTIVYILLGINILVSAYLVLTVQGLQNLIHQFAFEQSEDVDDIIKSFEDEDD